MMRGKAVKEVAMIGALVSWVAGGFVRDSNPVTQVAKDARDVAKCLF